VWEDNLDFFLAQGLIADARYRFVVVCNGDVDDAWREKLDRVAGWLPNFEWHQRADEGRDVGAWRAVLNGEVRVGVEVKLIQRFILMNSSIRGPFVPEYYSEGWPEAVLGLLHSRRCPDCQLAGLLVDCNCDFVGPPDCHYDCDNPPGPVNAKLPSFLLAFDNTLFSLVNHTMFQGDAHYAEVALSKFVLAQGANWAVLSALGRRLDFRDHARFKQACSEDLHTTIWRGPKGTSDLDSSNSSSRLHFDGLVIFDEATAQFLEQQHSSASIWKEKAQMFASDSPLWGATHFGLAFHPLEQLFVKFDVRNSNAGLLRNNLMEVSTLFALRSSPWTVPLSAICCQPRQSPMECLQGTADSRPSTIGVSVQTPREGRRRGVSWLKGEGEVHGVGQESSRDLPLFPCVMDRAGREAATAATACNIDQFRSRVTRDRGSLLCRLAGQYASVFAQGARRGQTQYVQSHTDTLIIYAFAATESGSGVWEDNLDFFLAQGLIADARYRFVVVCNGEVDEAWREKLDRVADWLPNFEWHQRADEGRDVGAWRAVLNGEVRVGVDVKLIQRFILMNSSIRGPFVPEYYSEGWPEAVLGLLHSRRCPDCQLAGLLVDCNCEIPSRCPDTQQLDNHRAALDEAMLAFESDLLPLVSSLLKEVL
jgi:hypothetical protein